ncbi:MAG: hypothetical protein IJK65_07795 [Clostridiales bacterium]|nr:hypothetical protein [Clostridiales bacterium]MBR4010419.1 hypothetical protein [Clostridiales bacterium]
MKTVKKMAAIVLVGAMALSIAACKKGAKKVSADDFKKACEEVGLTVTEGSEEGLKQSIGAKNEDDSLDVAYMQAESTDDAKEGFEYFTSSVDSLEAMGAKVDKSSTKIEAEVEGTMFMYAVRADDTIITISAAGEEQVNTAKDLVKKLGI